jgi:2-keto-myo-inositol isomerase
MLLGLNGATIMRSSLDDDAEIAAECGYSALEVWADKVAEYARERPLEQLGAKLRSLGVQPWCIDSIEDITFRDVAGRRALLDELRRVCDVARAVGAPSIVVVPGRRDDGFNRGESVADAVDVLRAMSEVSGEISLAFEFLGKPGCSVPVLDMAVEIVEQVDRPNVGMVIDTFHFYAGGSRLEDIAEVPAGRLFVVHLNGCEDIPRSDLTDAHRLYPGEGALPIDAILREIRKIGYDGVFSVEIFRPEYWGQDARHVARIAREKAEAVLRKAGYIDG